MVSSMQRGPGETGAVTRLETGGGSLMGSVLFCLLAGLMCGSCSPQGDAASRQPISRRDAAAERQPLSRGRVAPAQETEELRPPSTSDEPARSEAVKSSSSARDLDITISAAEIESMSDLAFRERFDTALESGDLGDCIALVRAGLSSKVLGRNFVAITMARRLPSPEPGLYDALQVEVAKLAARTSSAGCALTTIKTLERWHEVPGTERGLRSALMWDEHLGFSALKALGARYRALGELELETWRVLMAYELQATEKQRAGISEYWPELRECIDRRLNRAD